MITHDELISIGFKHVATAKNGGSKIYNDPLVPHLILRFNGDNFIYKKENNPLQYLLTISSYKEKEYEIEFESECDNIEDLKTVLEKIKRNEEP